MGEEEFFNHKKHEIHENGNSFRVFRAFCGYWSWKVLEQVSFSFTKRRDFLIMRA